MADLVGDDVQLTDLEVIQQFSLAVRGSSAPRHVVIEALEADLAWLRVPMAPEEAPAKRVRKAAVPRKAARRTEA